MRFVIWTYRIAGIYGLLLLAPFYGFEKAIGETGTPITHPEYFYGFVGAALAGQLLLLLISTDPLRYRPAMGVAIFSKISFGAAAWVLWLGGRCGIDVLTLGSIDLLLAVFFVVSWGLTASPQALAKAENSKFGMIKNPAARQKP